MPSKAKETEYAARTSIMLADDSDVMPLIVPLLKHGDSDFLLTKAVLLKLLDEAYDAAIDLVATGEGGRTWR